MKTLYTQYSGYATATCMRYVTESEAVKDILQDSFVKILTSIERFEYRGEGSLKAWIRTLVANLALDYLRKNNRLCFTDDIPQEMEDEPPVSIVILTDGGAPFPKESRANGIPVLWIINNNEVTPPWGKIARIVNNVPK